MDSRIRVGPPPFSLTDEYRWLAATTETGAIVTFTGQVRQQNLSDEVTSLYLEYYPAMTEKVLANLVQTASQRWMLLRVVIIHRSGELLPGEEIVLVGVSAAHRHEAFNAATFLIDALKTEAPFWKRERMGQKTRWIAPKDSDQRAIQRWYSEPVTQLSADN